MGQKPVCLQVKPANLAGDLVHLTGKNRKKKKGHGSHLKLLYSQTLIGKLKIQSTFYIFYDPTSELDIYKAINYCGHICEFFIYECIVLCTKNLLLSCTVHIREIMLSGLFVLQASTEDHSLGAGIVAAHLWDGGELRVLGFKQSEYANAAELPQLCFAAVGLHDCAQHPKRLVYLTFALCFCCCYLLVSE